MKKTWLKRIGIAGLVLGLVAVLAGARLDAQQGQLPAPSPLEKELAAKASDVTEVTLNKSMLGFAAKFMDKDDKNNKDDVDAKQLIQGLDGIYVREYEFDHEGEVTPEKVEQLRSYYMGGSGEWTPMVHERENKGHETTDVMMKMVNGETHGLFVLTAEPKELTIVLILGPIKMEDLHKLKGIGGLGALGGLDKGKTVKGKSKGGKGDSE
jgi:hypothetical protein